MGWPDKDTIVQGVVDMLSINMKFKPDEKLLVVSDYPLPSEWQIFSQIKLEDMLERVVLAKIVSEVTQAQFPESQVGFHPFLSTGQSGREPDDVTAEKMSEPDVLLCLTEHSLSQTNARQSASQAGVRIASMPGFTHDMLNPGGPMAVDYQQVSGDCYKFARLLSNASDAVVRTSAGTDLSFSLLGRLGQVDDGLYGDGLEPWGNLPAGEAYAIPLEGTGEGRLVVPAGWYPELDESLILTFTGGLVVDLEGGGKVGEQFSRILDLSNQENQFLGRRNLAELGIGTNPNAERADNVLEAEKIKGTVHIAIGDNIHMGGEVESDLHEDFVLPQVDLYLDGKPVILQGEWQV